MSTYITGITSFNFTIIFDGTRYPLGDVNMDYRVDMSDIYIAAKAYGSYPGHPKWNPIADINHDNRVDMQDIYTIAQYYGKY